MDITRVRCRDLRNQYHLRFLVIIDCNEFSIKRRAQQWINQLKEKGNDDIILVSTMAVATKVPAIGEFSQRYHVWVGVYTPYYCINEKDFNHDEFVTTKLATEIKHDLQ